VNEDGTLQHSARSFPSYEHFFFGRYSLLTRLFPRNPYSRKFLNLDWDHSGIRDVDWLSGACLLHRREVLDQLGSLDEQFYMYFEDVDFCRRAHEKGWKVQYQPECRVLHYIGVSSGHARRRMLFRRHQSIWRYYLKYFRRNLVKDVVIATGLFVRCLFQMAVPRRFSGRP